VSAVAGRQRFPCGGWSNHEIARIGATLEASITSGFEFVCEGGDLRCQAIVNMALDEYARTTPGSVVGH
jgi:hypothetical protein